MCRYVSAHGCAYVRAGAHRLEVSDALKLKLQMIVSCQM